MKKTANTTTTLKLNPTMERIMLFLKKAPQPVNKYDIMDNLQISDYGRITMYMKRLERAELVESKPDPTVRTGRKVWTNKR